MNRSLLLSGAAALGLLLTDTRALEAQAMAPDSPAGVWRAELRFGNDSSIVRYLRIPAAAASSRRDSSGQFDYVNSTWHVQVLTDSAAARITCMPRNFVPSYPGGLLALRSVTSGPSREWRANADVLFNADGVLADDRAQLDSLRRTAARRWASGVHDSLAVRGPRDGWPVNVDLVLGGGAMDGTVRVHEIGVGSLRARRLGVLPPLCSE